MAKPPKHGWVFVRHVFKPCNIGCHFRGGFGCLTCDEPADSWWHIEEEE